MEPYISDEHSILNIGCGNSRMSEEMYADGFENIVSIDNNEEVIEFMKSKCNNLNENFRCKN